MGIYIGPAPVAARERIEKALFLLVECGARRLYIGQSEARNLAAGLLPSAGVASFCGVPVETVTQRSYIAAEPPCPHCNDAPPMGARFCVACGAALAATGETVRLAR